MLGFTTFILASNYYENNKPLANPNYLVCYQSGLCKIDATSRQTTKYDFDTGVRGSYEGNVYALIQSRSFVTNDFGKTFPVRIN